jgi:hypothetical protein
MRESGIHKKYNNYKLEHHGRSQPPVGIDDDTPIDIDGFPDYPKITTMRKYKNNYGIDIIEKSINIKNHVVIHNEDYKGFAFAILSQ